MTFYELKTPRDSSGKRATLFKAAIEAPQNYDYFEEISYELRSKGYLLYTKPIAIDSKLYDFTYHESIESAQEFCKSLGYEFSNYSPQDGTWSGKIFRLK